MLAGTLLPEYKLLKRSQCSQFNSKSVSAIKLMTGFKLLIKPSKKSIVFTHNYYINNY